MHICIDSPCYNEEAVIERFYRELTGILDQLSGVTFAIILVDDGSSDGTLDIINTIAAEDERVSLYALSRNFGHQIALSAGIDVAAGDAVLMMDSDLQHPPSLIPQMIEHLRAGADIVSAVRADSASLPVLKRSSSRMFYQIINWMSEVHVVPGAADFCLLSSRAHQALLSLPERHRFLRGMVSWIGFNRVFLNFTAPERAAGQSKYTFGKMTKLALDAVFSFSAMPIRTATKLGLWIASAGFAYFIYIVTRYFFVGDLIQGWPSIIATLLIMGGVQLVFLGLLGEYVARIYEEAKGRPLYLLKQVRIGGTGMDPLPRSYRSRSEVTPR